MMIVKTPGSQMGSQAAAEEGGEEMGGGRWESGERSEVCCFVLLNRHWGIVTVPGSFLKAGDLGWPDPHPSP